MIRALLVGMIAISIMPRSAVADDGDELVSVGLRPTDGVNGPTEIRRLAEAQKMRSLVDGLLQIISGHTVVRHDELGKLLRSSYMVDVFDCGEKLECVLKIIKPLQKSGYRTAVYGSYWVDADTAAAITYHFQMFTLSLADGRVLKRVEFELTTGQLEDPAAWRSALESLFADRARITVVSNVIDTQCTVDGEPCRFEPDGHTLLLVAGEHAMELSKKGHKSAARVVTVAGTTAQRIAFALEENPITAPTSTGILGTEGTQPSANAPGVVGMGAVTFAAALEPYNERDGVNNPAPPPGTPKLWHVAMFNVPSYVGVRANDIKRGDWQVGGQASVGLFPIHSVRMPTAFVKLTNETSGVTIQIGRMYIPTVNVTQPGMLGQTNNRFGQFNYSFNGAKITKSFRHLIFDLGLGRPEGLLEGDVPPLSAGFDSYDLEWRITYVAPEIKGILYNSPTPLTVAVSGAVGIAHAGIGDTVPMGSEKPVEEDLKTFIFAGEVTLPLGPIVLTGGGYFGQGAGYYGGAVTQKARLDVTTGLHGMLRSAGAWGQLSLPLGRNEVMAVAGQDWVYKGKSFGVDVRAVPAITLNRVAGVVLTRQISKMLKIGLQLEKIWTDYAAGDMSNFVAVTYAVLRF